MSLSLFKRERLAGLVGLGVISLAIGSIVYLLYINYLYIPVSASLLDVGNVVGSLVLSSLLVILYFMVYNVQRRQEDIQEQQADIMEKQEELMAAEHLPIIEPDRNGVQGSSSALTIPVSNFGNGLAKNLSVRYDVGIQKPDMDTDLSPHDQPLTRQSGRSVETMGEKTSQTSSKSKAEPERIIYPDETDVTFEGNFWIDMSNTNAKDRISYASFKAAMVKLAAMGVDEIQFSVYLEYEDITGRRGEEPVLGRTSVEVDESLTVTKALDRGHQFVPGPEGTTRVRVELPSGFQRVKWELRRLWKRLFSDKE